MCGIIGHWGARARALTDPAFVDRLLARVAS